MKMQRVVRVAALFAVLGSGLSLPAHADNQSACGAVMCLYGDATGSSGGSACNKYENPYYQIQIFNHGIFDPPKTLDARKAFLDQCTSVNSSYIHTANSGGTSQWGPNGPPKGGTGGGSGGGHGRPGNGGGGCRNDPNCVIP